jgi:hypothetical protein
MEYVIARLREPSTWRGLALLVGAFGVQLHPDAIPAIGSAVASVIAAIEVFRRG